MAEQLDALPTARGRAKAERRDALLANAAQLFADRGFDGVSIEDLGSSVGVSGPAVYRHFPSKQAVLAALLIEVSEGLVEGGRRVIATAPDSRAALSALVEFHVEFALSNPDVIVVQDRDLASLTDDDNQAVRRLQRTYIDAWVDVLADLHPGIPRSDLRIRARATFGLINSTPHSARSAARASVRTLLAAMALAALTS